MQQLIPVNPTSPVPRSPPIHRDKRRRESEPPLRRQETDKHKTDTDTEHDDDNDFTIDEYA